MADRNEGDDGPSFDDEDEEETVDDISYTSSSSVHEDELDSSFDDGREDDEDDVDSDEEEEVFVETFQEEPSSSSGDNDRLGDAEFTATRQPVFSSDEMYSDYQSHVKQLTPMAISAPTKQPRVHITIQHNNSSVELSPTYEDSSTLQHHPQTTTTTINASQTTLSDLHPTLSTGDLSAGVLPDVLMTMRQKLESMTIFDSTILNYTQDQDNESREILKRSSQQSISAAVLVSLAHKRYERRRLAAMEIEKTVRSLVIKQTKGVSSDWDRIRAILLLLSDDYVRSTNEDARKGGVVALAACAIGLKKAVQDVAMDECRDLILASVVHACQDHSSRVRYYATESLFNVVKVIPTLAVQHFFILFEVLRSLYADVDSDVRSGAELLDKKLKEVIVGAMNAGLFTADQCVPVFAKFVDLFHKPTKRLTLSWLQELNEKLIGAPILEFLHLFLRPVIEMVADPSVGIRQSALAFLQSVLPKLLMMNSEAVEENIVVDFDKILQSLVTTLEHANPFVRKVACYWMMRVVKAHTDEDQPEYSLASLSVRNSVPHVLPGILLSIGDDFVSNGSSSIKDSFLPDQTTRSLAQQTNECLQNAVRRDGQAYVEHLDGFIVSLREELASPGGFSSKNPPAVERTPYRMDVVPDGTGIETAGWFRTSGDVRNSNDEALVMSRLCALHWVIVLYESVVPDALKADYAREFAYPIIHQLADSPPETIIYKSLEVLARITVPVSGENNYRPPTSSSNPLSGIHMHGNKVAAEIQEFPLTDSSVTYALSMLDPPRRRMKSRDREVFSALIQLHSRNEKLLVDLSEVITYMCKLQPPEFVMVSFAVELDRFVKTAQHDKKKDFSASLRFVSSFIQHLNHVLLNTDETRKLRDALKDCIATKDDTEEHHQRSRLFHILLHSFSHNIAATLSLCLWAGAYRTAFSLLNRIDPLDINLITLLEMDRLVEMLERPLFRHLHVRMLEKDQHPTDEGSGVMLFQLLKSLLMVLPQSTCYRVLRDRLVSVSRFRQNTMTSQTKGLLPDTIRSKKSREMGNSFASRVHSVRDLHCSAAWQAIRQESLEIPKRPQTVVSDEGADRRSWLGYSSKEEQEKAEQTRRDAARSRLPLEDPGSYQDFGSGVDSDIAVSVSESALEDPRAEDAIENEGDEEWKEFWKSPDKQ